MGYYTIRLSPTSQYMTATVTKIFKFKYNPLPMGMRSSGSIFQYKLDDLLGDIKVVETYINGILFLIKESFYKNIYQIIVIFDSLRSAGLNVNSPDFSFWLKDILYLEYVITWEDIKPDPKKLQGITDIGRSTYTTEARALICIVQYCRKI